MKSRYRIYIRLPNYKRGCLAGLSGFATSSLEQAIEKAGKVKAADYYGIYAWVKVKDMETRRYVYTA